MPPMLKGNSGELAPRNGKKGTDTNYELFRLSAVKFAAVRFAAISFAAERMGAEPYAAEPVGSVRYLAG